MGVLLVVLAYVMWRSRVDGNKWDRAHLDQVDIPMDSWERHSLWDERTDAADDSIQAGAKRKYVLAGADVIRELSKLDDRVITSDRTVRCHLLAEWPATTGDAELEMGAGKQHTTDGSHYSTAKHSGRTARMVLHGRRHDRRMHHAAKLAKTSVKRRRG